MTSYLWGNLAGILFMMVLGVLFILRGRKIKKQDPGSKKAVVYLVIGCLLIAFKVYPLTQLVTQNAVASPTSWPQAARDGFIDGCIKGDENRRSLCVCVQSVAEQHLSGTDIANGFEVFNSPKGQKAIQASLNQCEQ